MGTDIHIAVEVWREGAWHLADVDVSEDRNYRAFAILANVRNGYGFGGFDTGDEVEPIAEPRGLPDDLSEELRRKLEQPGDNDDDEDWFWLGDHSHSWVTLRELLDVDLDAKVVVRGYVSEAAAWRWKENGEAPRMHMAWTPQPGFVKMEWEKRLGDSAPLISTLISEVSPLGKPEEVRLVFGFDS